MLRDLAVTALLMSCVAGVAVGGPALIRHYPSADASADAYETVVRRLEQIVAESARIDSALQTLDDTVRQRTRDLELRRRIEGRLEASAPTRADAPPTASKRRR